MKKVLLLVLLILGVFFINTNVHATPVSSHGKLSVSGKNIVDKNGNIYQLRGVSTHGIYWFPKYVNQDAFNYMRDNWGINTIRLAMYSDPSAGRSESTYELVKKGVEYAKNSGLYVIIDWHILNDNDPNTYKSDAIDFFKKMANLYKDYNNVIYEICNEPHWVEWNTSIKPYAEDVIKEIRNIDDDAIIVVGTPTWSQDVDVAASNPITGYSNIMYTLHFYAGTHQEAIRNKLMTALNNANLPILVTEFGAVNADGNGGVNYNEANTWLDLLDKYKIGYVIWNLSNKNEGSALIRSDIDKATGWSIAELSEHGKWYVNRLKETSKIQPTPSLTARPTKQPVPTPTATPTSTSKVDPTSTPESTTEPPQTNTPTSTQKESKDDKNETTEVKKEKKKDNTSYLIIGAIAILIIVGIIILK